MAQLASKNNVSFPRAFSAADKSTFEEQAEQSVDPDINPFSERSALFHGNCWTG
jgi:hypothetical protein